jgi:PPM family protein phosphatase
MSDINPPQSGGLWARLLQIGSTPEEAAAETAPAPPVEATPADETPVVAEVVEIVAAIVPAPPPPLACPACGAVRNPQASYCDDCGWLFPAPGAAFSSESVSREPAMPTPPRLKDRYELGEQFNERQGVRRYRGRDAVSGQPVVIVAAAAVEAVAASDDVPMAMPLDEEILPGFDDEAQAATITWVGGTSAAWPSPAWEKAVLDKANHLSLPRPLDLFTEAGTEYLIEESPVGPTLWDAWYEPDSAVRYGYLLQIAEALRALHQGGALLEGIRPDLVVVNEHGQAVIGDLSDLLPLPLPQHPPLRATLYTAPELILSPATADARADLYSFGAMLYALEYLNHPLEEKDFERQFVPRQVTERFPDVHPLLLRLLNKTFVRDPQCRFPSDEAIKTDPSGLGELIKSLEVCQRTFDRVRLDIAAWTTTGMVRTGNEDAFAYLHGAEARQDDLYEFAMVLLCDGMGGYEAGEVAAAMTISEMRKYLLAQPMFAALAGKEPPALPTEPKAYQDVLRDALKHANREVYTASRAPGKGRRGMGCTAECVYIDAKNVIAGHVGDSRTYHLHKGRLVQLTRDQTLVNRLVELGQLAAAEAENHPRKNELQQAIGGQPEVVPGVYHGRLQRGDWVLVCSDGLSNHITNAELEKMLTREAAGSAEEAARRLLNLVNLRGATDNATIVVVRAS